MWWPPASPSATCRTPGERKLYHEVWGLLVPGGVFCNVEHAASPSARPHRRSLDALGITPEEGPSNTLLDPERQPGRPCSRSATKKGAVRQGCSPPSLPSYETVT